MANVCVTRQQQKLHCSYTHISCFSGAGGGQGGREEEEEEVEEEQEKVHSTDDTAGMRRKLMINDYCQLSFC